MLVFQSLLKASIVGQAALYRTHHFLAIGIARGKAIEVGSGTGGLIVPVKLVVDEVADEIVIIAEGRRLQGDGLLDGARPLRIEDQARPAMRPGGDVEVLGHRHVELMQDWIRPGSDALEAGFGDALDGGLRPFVELGGVGFVKIARDEVGPDRIAAVQSRLDRRNHVQKIRLALGIDEPPDALLGLPDAPEAGLAAHHAEAWRGGLCIARAKRGRGAKQAQEQE